MLLSDLTFGSFLSYSPNGNDKSAHESQIWVRRLKDELYVAEPPVPMSEYVAMRLAKRLHETELGQVLTPRAVLVPVPSSAHLKSSSLWVPYLLAQAMVRHGLGREVVTAVTRKSAIRKAATSAASNRPTAAEQFETMEAKPFAFPPEGIVLIDDVITRGATLIAAANRLKEICPGAALSAFAVVRTISNHDEFEGILAPCVGNISLRDGKTFRRP